MAANTREVIRARFGAQIRRLRLAHGWSQEELGVRAGLSYKFVGEVERGIGNPSLLTLAVLADAFETDVTDLFGPVDARGSRPFPLSSEEFLVVREARQELGEIVKRLAEIPFSSRKRRQKPPRAQDRP